MFFEELRNQNGGVCERDRLPLFPTFRVLNPLWPDFLHRRMSDDEYVASLRAELELVAQGRVRLLILFGVLPVLTFLALMQVEGAIRALVLNAAAGNALSGMILRSMTGTLVGACCGISTASLQWIPRKLHLLVRYADACAARDGNAAANDQQPSARASGRRFLPSLVLSRKTETDAEFIARMRDNVGKFHRLQPWQRLAVIPLLGMMAYISQSLVPMFQRLLPNGPDAEFWLWFTVAAVSGPLSFGLLAWMLGNLLTVIPSDGNRIARLVVRYYDEAGAFAGDAVVGKADPCGD